MFEIHRNNNRRGYSVFLRNIAYTAICVAGIFPDPSKSAPADEILRLSEDIGRWLITTTESTHSHNLWPDDYLKPEIVGNDLAGGVAGKVVFFSALYRATGNETYRSQAILGADHLVSGLKDLAELEQNNRKASLYRGIAGIGVALGSAADLVARDTYADAVNDVVAHLDNWKTTDDSGIYWSDEYNDLLYGDAGTILFLSWYAKKTENAAALRLAHLGAKSLLARAEDGTAGKYWRFRRSKSFNLPNFSHGTAGIGYVLATVGAITNDDELKQGAEEAFAYIRSIAINSDGLLQIPYGWPNDSWEGLFEFGWAHGLAGDLAFFTRLQQVGIDSETASTYAQLATKTLTSINLSGQLRPPFSEPSTSLDLRFGRAGVLAATSYAGSQANTERLDLQLSLWQQLAGAAIRGDRSAYWQTDVPEFMGGGQAAYTGLFHGAAGIGLALLALHAQLTDSDPYFDLPDFPY